VPQKIILDTDIGDDIDDAYALALILGSGELDLVGVTTVFKNTPARARLAQTILKLAARGEVPVAAGCGAVMSPRVTYREADLAEGQVSLGLAARELLQDERPKQCVAALPEEDLPALCRSHGVDFLVEAIMAGAGDIIPVTIGAMTNLAMALVKEPRLLRKIPRIVSMCGCFESERTEWNISCDPVAAGIVFGSGVPMTVVGLDVTLQVVLTEDERARVLSSDRPVARCLTEATRAWERRMPVLHDPLAVETLIRPEVISTRRGSVTVELGGGDTYGRTTFAPGDGGPHEVGTVVNADEAKSLWLERVLAL